MAKKTGDKTGWGAAVGGHSKRSKARITGKHSGRMRKMHRVTPRKSR
jgi:hypothetical protein